MSFVPSSNRGQKSKQIIMKVLQKEQLKSLKGGVYNPDDIGGHIPGLVGWELRPDGCYCDFANVAAEGGVSCWNSCPVSMCTEGSLDPNPPYYG